MTKILLSACLGMITAGCGSLTTTATSAFKLRMLAIYSPPAGADGSEAPQSETFLFKSLTLTKDDGTPVELFKGEATAYKVVDRPQLIYTNQDMSAYDGMTFSKATVEFDNAIVVTTKAGNPINLAMDTGTLELQETFSISKSKNQTLTIKTSWGKTVTTSDDGTESVSAPTFTMLYSNE